MKNGLKKEDSLLLYGISIFIMIYHHLFAMPEKLGSTDYYSVLNTVFGGITEQRFAWLLRLCVAFYAFVSGYGICTIISKCSYEERCSLTSIKNNYLLAFKQIFKLLKKFWLVFIIFIPMGVIFFQKSLFNTKTLLLSLLGLSNAYNAEWWYIKQYIMMVLLFPVFDFLLCNTVFFINNNIIKRFKYGKHILLAALFVCGGLFLLFRNADVFSFLIEQLNNGVFVFTVIFFIGFLCAFFHLFEFGADNATFQKLRPALALLMLLACVSIRYIRACDAAYCKYDTFITAPIVYSIVTLFSYIKIIPAFFRKLGKYSTYMWLTHTFFCFYYFSNLVLAVRISTFIFVLTLVVSWITAYVLTMIENKLNGLFKKHDAI